MRSRTRTLLAFALFALATMTACESGEQFRDVEAGKLAPPGAVLVSERSRDQDIGNNASYTREYETDLSAGEVLAYFDEALDASWSRAEPRILGSVPQRPQYQWRNGMYLVIMSVAERSADIREVYVTIMKDTVGQ